jgi:hypothetical protein
MATQTVEQFLLEQLERVAPGKYSLANVLEQFKSKLRFACTHLKGGGRRSSLNGIGKDYNLSVFTFPNGVTEVKCLYNCGLKARSDQKDLVNAFNQLYDLPSSNTRASSEVASGKRDPGPVPTYSDEYRQRIKESTDLFWKSITQGLENGRIKADDPILGALLPHPDPKEAPESIVERGIKLRHLRQREKAMSKPSTLIPENRVRGFDPEPIKRNTKIRKSRKTQSRKSGK